MPGSPPSSSRGPKLERGRRRCSKARPGVEQVAPFGTTLHVVGSDEARLKAALDEFEGRDGVKVARGETSLEDVFIQFMAGSKDNMP